MSNASQLDSLTQGESSVSVQTLSSRPLQPIPDPSASKRVCFYKSGDPKFGGHRMVINGRTFKTFDALLDALSKKVPLPFGVRTISTPRGTHSVRGLEDLHDGGSYVCSDRRRVKPLNLDVVHRRKVPWNTTRPPSTGRRSYGRRNEGPDKIGRRVSVRTPKRLVVVKNRDSTVTRTVLLQKRTAPTFDALLDYLSQVMQFPVLKLYSSDGRRVDGLAALILCSGVIVAAGNEPFRLGNYNTQTLSKYNVHTIAYMSQSGNSDAAEPASFQPLAYDNKPHSSGRGSRNFSLSSERYMADQINKSLNGGIHTHQHPHNGSLETDPDGNHTDMDMETQEPPHSWIMPQDEDIEKSFRVNQDGSMTVEMKVRLTIKEEELLHWTTTLSRSSLNSRTACASRSGTGLSLPDSNNVMDNDSSSSCHDAAKEENQPVANGKSVGFVENEPSSSVSNLLPNPATVNPVLRQLFSSSQCIRRASETENPAVTLRESLKGAVAGESHLPRSTSEAMLVMESLQKISTIDDELLQRSSLTDLHNSTSSDLRDRWRDFQVHRERLKSEPLSPKVSEQEFALDVSEPGDMFDMTDIMDELNMPQDLREQISSTIRQTMSFYPEDEESTFIEREKHHSESEEELERFHKENADETKLSQEPDSLSIAEEKENSQLPTQDLNGTIKRQSLCREQNDPISDSKLEVDEVQEMKEAGETDTWEHGDQSKHLENLSEPGLVTDDCGSETSVNAKKEEVERDSLKDGYQERLTELENEVENGEEEFEKLLQKEEVLEETQDEDNNSLMSVKAKRERDEAGEENIEDDMERWKEEEASTPEVGEDVNKEILEVKSEEEEWCKQGIDEKELDEGQTEPGEFTDGNQGEATGDSSGEMGFTDKENEVDEEDEEPEVVEEKEADSVEDELEKASPIEKEVAEEDDKGESTDEQGEGDVADKEMGEESCEESDEESCGKDIEEGKDEEDEVDIEAEQQVEGEQSSVEEKEDEVDLEAEQEVEGEQSSVGGKGDEVDLEAEQEVEGEQSSVEEKEDEVDLEAEQEVEGEQSSDGGKEDEVDLEAEQEVEGEQSSDGGKEDEVDLEAEQEVEGEQSSDEEKEDEVDLEAEQQVEGVKSSDEEKEDEDEEDAFDLGVRAEETDLNDEKDEPTGKLLIAHADISICEEDNNDNSDNEKANKKTEKETDEAGSLKSRFNESQFEDEKDNASDTAHDLRSEDGGNEEDEENRSQIPTPVEISQELIDFVNSALQSSSLKFTYDILGNVRIEPDQAKVIHTQQMLMTKGREDILYRLKQLPSPNTSDLSDYRPETSVSGGYNTQESIDIVTGSGDELENMSLGNGDPAPGSEMSDQTSQLTDSIPSLKSNSGPRLKTFSSSHSGTKASKEDLSYSSAAGSLKADPEVASQVADLNSNGGVLIDKGRWLLKENHLIRKSPPALMGMYDDADSSPGMSPDNTSEDSHQHALTHKYPLAVLSSSDLEEMAKPHRPKCNYYNMPHGSDSDPFLDDLSLKSSKRKASNGKGKGLKVSPTVDTSKTWLKKNDSLSSFASVEFKMQDSRVHPEGDRAAVAPATTPPGGAGHVLLAQDSVDEFRRRCGQYCPIL
ncbi:unnamed protein product [Boreogadus saida]